MQLLGFMIAGAAFILSAGIFYNDQFRRNYFAVAVAGVIALASTYFLFEALYVRFEHTIIEKLATRPPEPKNSAQPEVASLSRDPDALPARAAKAEYNRGLLYLEGQQFPQDFKRAAELFRAAAEGGNPEAQYALATLYKEGRGVAKDSVEAARWLAAAARAGNIDGEVEYAIALYNGTGVARDEAGAAALLRKAALRGSPIAQNRLARILATGKGLPADAAAATKWHLVAKAGGAGDPWLDTFVQGLKPSDREAGEKAAKTWLDALQPPRS